MDLGPAQVQHLFDLLQKNKTRLEEINDQEQERIAQIYLTFAEAFLRLAD
jgi:hypothetical protein